MGARRSGIRWREDVGWEARCDDCARRGNTTCYWPLTEEFWDRKVMTRCRACHLAKRRIRDHATYWSKPEVRAKKLAESQAYRREAAHSIQIKRKIRQPRDSELARIYYWSDPEGQRAKSRAYYHRNRDRILEKRRAGYVSRKAA